MVMSEDRERVLRMALKALLVGAQECCVDIDELTELAIRQCTASSSTTQRMWLKRLSR